VEYELDLRSIGKEFSALLLKEERPCPQEIERLLRALAASEGNVLSLLVETLAMWSSRSVTANSFFASANRKRCGCPAQPMEGDSFPSATYRDL